MRSVLVFGGSRGIGAACVRVFAREGDRVAFTYRSSREQAALLEKETGALPVLCDAADEKAMLGLPERLPFRPDTLVYSAGVAHTGLIQDMTVPEWDTLQSIDLRGAFLAVKAFVPFMISRKRGSIVLIGSMWGQAGASCEAAYSAAKAGVTGLMKALAKELGPSGIRVNAVSPGVVDTDMMAAYSKEDREALRQETPLERLGTPQDIAESVEFLCSARASFITGVDLPVNGGFVI